jgi:hypothetical protein
VVVVADAPAAELLVRVQPELDRTNGFFVALFVRCADAAPPAAADPTAEPAAQPARKRKADPQAAPAPAAAGRNHGRGLKKTPFSKRRAVS